MNERTTLLNIILALINQSYGSNKNESLLHIVDEAFELIRTPAMVGDGADSGSLLIMLKEFAEELRIQGTKLPYDYNFLKLRIKTLAVYHKDVKDLLQEEIDDLKTKDVDSCNGDYTYYHNTINTFVRESKFQTILFKWACRIRESQQMLQNREEALREMNAELAPYVASSTGFNYTDINGIVSEVDVENEEKLGEIYQEIQELTSSAGVLKFDMQGWNEAFGKNGGVLRGTLGELQAMSGCGKSETMRKMLTGIARSNDPLMIDDKKKPLILYLTLEDTQREAYEKMFTQMYSEEFDVLVDITKFDYKDICAYVSKTLTAKGYHFKVIEGEKHKVTPYDVISLLESLNSQGYEIHALGLDYMLLLDLSNVPGFMDTYKIKNSYGIIGAYTKTRGITCITAAQIDDSAKSLMLESDEFAKDAVERNYSAGSKYIIHELDWRIFTHVTDGCDGFWYHQLAIGKNRTSRMTPYKDKYAVYRMHMVKDSAGVGRAGGFIKTDFDGESQVRSNTAGNLRSMGGGMAF